MMEAVHLIERRKEVLTAKELYVLGNDYYLGRGRLQNLEEVVKWWRIAAEQGHAEAQFNLEMLILKEKESHKTTKKQKSGFKWLRLKTTFQLCSN